MKIRKATRKDKEIIKKIFSEGYSKPPFNEKWPPEMLDKRISDYLKYYENVFVLEVDKNVEGFIIFCFYAWYTGLRGYINEVVVAPKSQGKGYGKALMEFAESYMKKKGAKEVCLLTSPEAGAFKMYQKRDYKDEGFVNLYKVLK
jgi:aminoglycoside 6'-N-acetyltransferase I